MRKRKGEKKRKREKLERESEIKIMKARVSALKWRELYIRLEREREIFY